MWVGNAPHSRETARLGAKQNRAGSSRLGETGSALLLQGYGEGLFTAESAVKKEELKKESPLRRDNTTLRPQPVKRLLAKNKNISDGRDAWNANAHLQAAMGKVTRELAEVKRPARPESRKAKGLKLSEPNSHYL